jgi:ribosomal protein S18 acetylase RimI-like enzyme
LHGKPATNLVAGFLFEQQENEVKLRIYRRSDLERMVELDRLCFAPEFLFGARAMRGFAENAGASTIIAETEARELAGFVIAQLERGDGQPFGYCVTIDVAPQFRGQALGKELLHAAEDKMRSAGARAMHLHVYTENAGAIAFYERMGYMRGRRVARFYGRAGLDAFQYSRPL